MSRFEMKHPRLAALFALVALLGTFGLLAVLCINHEPHATTQSVGTLPIAFGGGSTFAKPDSQQPLNDQRHYILSLRVQGDRVFASTDEGLYRARLDKKQWEPLRANTVPEAGGLFVLDPPEEKTLLYIVTPGACQMASFRVHSNTTTKKIQRPGMYRSPDQGDTWELLNNAYDFDTVVHLQDGRLFALAGLEAGLEKDKKRHRVVLVSENGGREWKDITNGVGRNPLLSFSRDPDCPQRVCLFSAFTMRTGGTIFQAADEKFLWKDVYSSLHAENDWPPIEKKTEEEFFYHWYFVGYSLSWAAGTVSHLPEEFPGTTFEKNSGGFSTTTGTYARLDNYFDLPFQTDTKVSAFNIVPEMPAYDFQANQPFNVKLALTHFEETGRMVLRLVDSKNPRFFWSLKVCGPDGLKRDLWSKHQDNPFDEPKQGQKLANILKTHDAWQFVLSPKKPACRTIDLRDLGMPDEPGTYRVQLRYSCSWCDDESIRRRLGTVTGQVFTVRIQAAEK